MGKTASRIRVEPGIYKRRLSTGGFKYDVIFRKPNGVQSFRTANDLAHARAMRIEYLKILERGKLPAQEPTNGPVAELLQIDRYANTVVPTKQRFREAMAATGGMKQRKAWLLLAGLALAMARRLEASGVYTAPNGKIQTCENCGNEFIPKRSDAKFCSGSCRSRNAEKRYRVAKHA